MNRLEKAVVKKFMDVLPASNKKCYAHCTIQWDCDVNGEHETEDVIIFISGKCHKDKAVEPILYSDDDIFFNVESVDDFLNLLADLDKVKEDFETFAEFTDWTCNKPLKYVEDFAVINVEEIELEQSASIEDDVEFARNKIYQIDSVINGLKDVCAEKHITKYDTQISLLYYFQEAMEKVINEILEKE